MNGPPAPKRTDVPTANHDGMQMSNPSPEEADDKVFWKTSPPAARKLAEIVDHRVLRENSGTYGEKLSGENTSENRGLRVDRSNLVESNGAEFVPIANQRTTPRGFKRAVTISNIPGDSPTTRKRTCTHWAQRGKPLPVEITPAPSINKTSCGLPLNDVTEKSPRGSNARMARSISSPTVLSKSRQSVDQKKPTRPLREITENVNHSSSTANHGSKSIGTGEVQSKSTLETEKENLPGPLHGTPNTVKDQLSRERKSGLDQAQLLNSKSSGTFAKSKDVSGATVIRSKKRQQKFHRCIVMRVAYGKFSLNNGLVADEKVLHMLSLESDTKILAHLRGDWIETEVNVGDIVHLIGTWQNKNVFIVDNEQNLLVLHPDVLVSSTHAAESFTCCRKSILQDRIKAQNEISPAMVFGKMLHDLMESALLENNFSTKFFEQRMEELVHEYMEDLYAISDNEEHARVHLHEQFEGFQMWASQFYRGPHISDQKSNRGPKKDVAVTKILDIEEHVWSPTFGLKGNIDATVQFQNAGTTNTLIGPFELKTGKSSNISSHRAQTILYTLLMSDRYDVDIQSGLLYYLKTGEMITVPALRNEIRGLVIGRNRLSKYLTNKQQLPPMQQNLNLCGRCFALQPCVLYHKAVEQGDSVSSGLGDLFTQSTQHLNDNHLKFFSKWDHLLTLEEAEAQKIKTELWTVSANEREQLKNCFSNMIISQTLPTIAGNTMSKYQYKLTKNEVRDNTAAKPLLGSHISVGDPIVVSSLEGHYALAIGYVTELQEKHISIAIDRPLQGLPMRAKGFHPSIRQDFHSKIHAKINHCLPESAIEYRIDKDELQSGMGSIRNNLVTLMSATGNSKLRRLIVDLEPPLFDIESSIESNHLASGTLNADQQHAINKVMSARDYALILGMPGTGKTTTIAHIIKMLVSKGSSVLMSSYTHSAVDNVLLKLKEMEVDFLRIGSPNRIHPDLLSYSPHNANIKNVADLEDFLSSKQVVATTCLGINHAIFTKRCFDYCIVDEASQLTLPVCLGPIRFANVFILVGDHYQLPPLVRNLQAGQEGLSVSLFKMLSEAHSNAVVQLEHQYRMNGDIMLLANHLIYQYRLKCGTSDIATKTMNLPQLSSVLEEIHSVSTIATQCREQKSCWLTDVLDPGKAVIFLNTDVIPAMEAHQGDLVHNDVEAIIAAQIVNALVQSGASENSIGVISPYRSQLRKITKYLGHLPSVDILTVDKYQGRDKDCIVVSLVRSNSQQNIGELLKDWRRVNVALTRAKSKIILIGSIETLSVSSLFDELLSLCKSQNWVFSLPKDAHLAHSLTLLRTPTSHGTQNRKQGGTNVAKRYGVSRQSQAEIDPFEF